jgi:hypothetical protein
MVGGVGLHDSEGAPAEMQEFLVEQFGETVYGCGNHRAGKAYLGLGAGGSLSREVGGVFEGCRQRSVSCSQSQTQFSAPQMDTSYEKSHPLPPFCCCRCLPVSRCSEP